MNEYHKIQSVFKRDPDTNYKTFLQEYSLPEFGYLQFNEWVGTEKIDGTNIRVMYDGSAVSFGGKTENAQIPAQLVARLLEVFPVEKFQEVFNDTPVCLYGEGCGAKIQKGGGDYRADQDFILFDIKIGSFWLQRTDVEELGVRLGLDVTPIMIVDTLDAIVAEVKAKPEYLVNSTIGTAKSEGLVIRPSVELKARNGDRIITKLKFRDFQ